MLLGQVRHKAVIYSPPELAPPSKKSLTTSLNSLRTRYVPQTSGRRLCPNLSLQLSLLPRLRHLPTAHPPARLLRSHHHPFQQAPLEGLRPQLRHLAPHRDEHLRVDCLEGVLANDGSTGREPEFEGTVVALFQLLFTWNDKGRTQREAFCRDRLPDIMNLVATAVVFGRTCAFLSFPYPSYTCMNFLTSFNNTFCVNVLSPLIFVKRVNGGENLVILSAQ